MYKKVFFCFNILNNLKYNEPFGHFEPDDTYLNGEYGIYHSARLFQTAINTGL